MIVGTFRQQRRWRGRSSPAGSQLAAHPWITGSFHRVAVALLRLLELGSWGWCISMALRAASAGDERPLGLTGCLLLLLIGDNALPMSCAQLIGKGVSAVGQQVSPLSRCSSLTGISLASCLLSSYASVVGQRQARLRGYRGVRVVDQAGFAAGGQRVTMDGSPSPPVRSRRL